MKKQSIIQAVIVFVVLAAAVFVMVNQTLPPTALPASAPATEFSAERAIEHIEVIAQEPRLIGSPGFERARDYVVGTLTGLGLTPEIQRTAKAENIIARIEGTESQEAILLVAHNRGRSNKGK